jgi:Methyltransferase domain
MKAAIVRIPIFGRAILTVLRAKIALSYLSIQLRNLARWLLTSKETTNFTYDLDEQNKRYLASLIADILTLDYSLIERYIREIEEDDQLKRHVSNVIQGSRFAGTADREVRLGRRVGWYAIARALKPRVIVETGVDKGLGACTLTAALKRNREDGYDGKYYGLDINPRAGYLLCGEYANYGRILYGDSLRSLAKFEGSIDLFINDSDHSADYEYAEFLAVLQKLSDRALVLGDNSHCTDSLLRFSLITRRHFIFFQERPVKHWYPGAGIGISFNRAPSGEEGHISRIIRSCAE